MLDRKWQILDRRWIERRDQLSVLQIAQMLAGSASTMKEGEELSELEARALEGNILRKNYEWLYHYFLFLKVKERFYLLANMYIKCT